MNPSYIGFVLDKLNTSFIPHLLSHIRKSFKPPIHPPLGGIRVLSIGIRARSLIIGFTALRVRMSARDLVHDHTFIFDGTNYDVWKIRMLSHFRAIDPHMERIVDIGFSPPMDSQNLSLEDEKNLYLNAQLLMCLFML